MNHFQQYIILIAAIAPAIILAFLVIRKDKTCPEPSKWLLGAAGLGVLAGLAVIIIAIFLLKPVEIDSISTAFYTAFVTAAIPEEAMKLVMLAIIANRCKHFDEYFDGIVYAVCIGMGFAAFENIIYLFGEDDWLVISISRALLAVPAHYFFAIIMGAFFAMSYFEEEKRKRYKLMAFIVPVAAHGVYDSLCFSLSLDEDLCLFVLIAFIIGFKWIRKYTKQLIVCTLRLDYYNLYSRE